MKRGQPLDGRGVRAPGCLGDIAVIDGNQPDAARICYCPHRHADQLTAVRERAAVADTTLTSHEATYHRPADHWADLEPS